MDEREYLKQLQKLLEREDDVHETIRSAEDRLKTAEKEVIEAREHLCLQEEQAKHDGEVIRRQRLTLHQIHHKALFCSGPREVQLEEFAPTTTITTTSSRPLSETSYFSPIDTVASCRTECTGSQHNEPTDHQRPKVIDPQCGRQPDRAKQASPANSDPEDSDTFPRKFEVWDYLPYAPTIVLAPEGWVEIACHIGHGNCQSYTSSKGLTGLKKHVLYSHKISLDNPNVELVEIFKTRNVPAIEALNIMNWSGKNTPVTQKPFKKPALNDEDDPMASLTELRIASRSHDESKTTLRRRPTPRRRSTPVALQNTNCRVSEPEIRGYKIGSMVRKATSIVLTDKGKWVELRCYICHGNACRGGQLAKAPVGFQSHLRTAHKVTLTREGVIKKCAFREVSDEEVKSIENFNDKDFCEDRDPIEHIQFQSTTSEGGQGESGYGEAGDDLVAGDMSTFSDNAEHSNERQQNIKRRYSTMMIDELYASSESSSSSRRRTSTSSDDSADLDARTRDSSVGGSAVVSQTVPQSTFCRPYTSEGLTENRDGPAILNESLSMSDIDQMCPCTLDYHTCRNLGAVCNKKKLCLAATHDSNCLNDDINEPSICPEYFEVGTCRTTKPCTKAHNRRRNVWHDCMGHGSPKGKVGISEPMSP